MPRRTGALWTLFSFLVPAAAIAGAIIWFFVELQPVDSRSEKIINVTILEQSGVRVISKQLQDTGLIRNRYAFQAAVVLAGISKDLKAGEYELSPKQSATAIARQLSKIQSAKEIELTILEGWTSKQIGEYLESKGIGTTSEFVTAASVHDSRDLFPDKKFDFLVGRPATATLEGYLFPDTYRVFADATVNDVILKMLENFEKKLSSTVRQDVAEAGRTIHEVVTMGSIVEKEVRSDRDRAMVADIFWRRIKIGMPLQSDATVNYVTGKSSLQPTINDTEVNSPYNTYRAIGLPPGPIGNPGIASIVAAARPSANSYFYFLTDASGAVHFATTYDQHLENKQKFL